MLTLDQLRKIMPRLPQDKAQSYFQPLVNAMTEAGITTRLREAAFLAQIAHESAEFRYMEEIADGSHYEGRKDLGNVNPGDGKRYKGRGPIQLTGRLNYRRCGQALGLDLEGHPEQAATPSVGFRAACWYWTNHHLNDLADQSQFDAITKAINGGYNGKAQRDAYYARALSILV